MGGIPMNFRSLVVILKKDNADSWFDRVENEKKTYTNWKKLKIVLYPI